MPRPGYLNYPLNDERETWINAIARRLAINPQARGAAIKAIDFALQNTIFQEDTMNDKLTREQAVARVGEEYVAAVEAENCEPTSRLRDDYDTTIEHVASVLCEGRGEDGVDVVLEAFYYPDEKEFITSFGEPVEDLSNIDWKIEFYRIA